MGAAAAAEALALRAKAARGAVSRATTAQKNAVLRRAAQALRGPGQQALLDANAADLAAADGLSEAMRDRLRLDARRLEDLARAIEAVAALPDPVGQIDQLRTQPSGIQVGKMTVPLGTILMVYESRPNVTLDAAALGLKSGNGVILRGGSEARRSNEALLAVFRTALQAEGLPEDGALGVTDPDRELLYALLQRDKEIDLVIPRGGTALIEAVASRSRIPVIRHWKGVCHVYVHGAADLDAAVRIAVNAKAQRPGVCNAMECLLVDAAVAPSFVARVVDALGEQGVEVRGCARTQALHQAPNLVPAVESDWDEEFLAKICALRVVDGLDEALAFVEAHGTHHSEAILTNDQTAAWRWLREVDASCVLVNASTRFNDGGELGLGAELGISTTKLHAYGPMGLEELCAKKYVVLGQGEVRGGWPAP